MASSISVYGAQRGKTSSNTRAKGQSTRGVTAATRAKTASSVLRVVKNSKTKEVAPNATSSATDSLLTNINRFVGRVYGETVKYGKSYALQDMLTPEVWQYYYDNGSSNVSAMNSSSSVLDEQFCFGPYMTLVGRDGTTDYQIYTHVSNNIVKCVALEKNTVYTLSLIEATDQELLNALTTTSQNNLPNDGRRFAYVSRSGTPVDTMFFSTETYFNVSKIIEEIKQKLATAKESCGTFAESMDKLKSLLGWGSVTSGVGMAASGVALGLGVYDVKKTDDMAKDIMDEENIWKDMKNVMGDDGYLWRKFDDKTSLTLWYTPKNMNVSAANDKNTCQGGGPVYTDGLEGSYCPVKTLDDWEDIEKNSTKSNKDGTLGGIKIILLESAEEDVKKYKDAWDAFSKQTTGTDTGDDSEEKYWDSNTNTPKAGIQWVSTYNGHGFINFINSSGSGETTFRALDALDRYGRTCRGLFEYGWDEDQASACTSLVSSGVSDKFKGSYADLVKVGDKEYWKDLYLGTLEKYFKKDNSCLGGKTSCDQVGDETKCCNVKDDKCCEVVECSATSKTKKKDACKIWSEKAIRAINEQQTKIFNEIAGVDAVKVTSLEDYKKKWDALPDNVKKQYALPNLYEKMLEETDNALALEAKVNKLNELSKNYKAKEDNIKKNANLTKGLDIGQVALASASLVSSGVNVVLSVSAFNEVDKAVANLKTCKIDMAEFKKAYDLYMTEYHDDYETFKEAKKKESGVAYDFSK